MIEISTRGQIHQFYKKVSSWLSFCFPTFNWLSSSQTCRLLVSAGGRGKKISMIFKLKTNQWSHLPPSVTPNECDNCRPHHATRHRTRCSNPFSHCLWVSPFKQQHTLYRKTLNDDACTEYGWNLFGEPFLYQNSSWMPSLIIFFRWIWTAAIGRKKLHKFTAWTFPSLGRKKTAPTNF